MSLCLRTAVAAAVLLGAGCNPRAPSPPMPPTPPVASTPAPTGTTLTVDPSMRACVKHADCAPLCVVVGHCQVECVGVNGTFKQAAASAIAPSVFHDPNAGACYQEGRVEEELSMVNRYGVKTAYNSMAGVGMQVNQTTGLAGGPRVAGACVSNTCQALAADMFASGYRVEDARLAEAATPVKEPPAPVPTGPFVPVPEFRDLGLDRCATDSDCTLVHHDIDPFCVSVDLAVAKGSVESFRKAESAYLTGRLLKECVVNHVTVEGSGRTCNAEEETGVRCWEGSCRALCTQRPPDCHQDSDCVLYKGNLDYLTGPCGFTVWTDSRKACDERHCPTSLGNTCPLVSALEPSCRAGKCLVALDSKRAVP